MRKSFGQLLTTSRDYVSDPTNSTTSSLSSTTDFLKGEINNCASLIHELLKEHHQTERTQTTATVASQQYYHLPPDFGSPISVTVSSGDTNYPLELITSREKWDFINSESLSYAPPTYAFFRRDDYGIWPTPPDATETITLTYNYIQKEMLADDYTTGTITTVQNDATVAGSGTTWVAPMVNRWFAVRHTSSDSSNVSSNWYRIKTFSSTVSIELETVFEETAVATKSYLIGESPEIPQELHPLIPHYAAAQFLAGPRRSFADAQAHMNYFWTGDFNNNSRRPSDAKGGLLAAIAQYSMMGRGSSGLVNRRPNIPNPYDERYRTVISL